MAIDVIEINVATGDRIEREFTDEELSQRELDKISLEKRKADEIEIEAKKLALLERLGITAEEANLLIS